MTTEPEPVIYIVDDDEAVRDSLRMLLGSVGHQAVAYPSARAFLDGYDPARAACLVLDIRMPDMDGLALQDELRSRQSNCPIVFITGHGDVPMAVQAMQRGAVDFLQKPFRDQEILDVIRGALEAGAGEAARRERSAETAARLETLTPREREVMDRVVKGQANKVIAIELGLSQRTVEIHRANVMRKMEAGSLAELVRAVMSIENGG